MPKSKHRKNRKVRSVASAPTEKVKIDHSYSHGVGYGKGINLGMRERTRPKI